MLDVNFIVALVVAVTVHEFSHAWMATMLGDPTARMQGRLSLNPLKHLDPVGTIMLFIARIGWGRPVPFNPHYLKNPKRDSALIALAGPLSNLIIVAIIAVPYRMLTQVTALDSASLKLFGTIISLNIVLMAFNLIPVPPLDGSKVLLSLLPSRLYPQIFRYRNYGYGLLVLLLLSPQLFGFSILGRIIMPIHTFFWEIILTGL
jgi:Zn-dependent protease